MSLASRDPPSWGFGAAAMLAGDSLEFDHVDQAQIRGHGSPTGLAPMELAPRFVLLDDHELVRDGISRQLLTPFPRATFSYSGYSSRNAVSSILVSGCDCAIVDLDLGAETPVAETVSTFTTRGIPVVVVSAMAAPGVQGLITGMSGGCISLLLIATTGVWIRFGVVLIAVMASACLSVQLPDACEQKALRSTAVTTIYMLAIAIVLIWIDFGFDSRRADAQQKWERLLSERVERESDVGEQSGWAAVPTSTQELLQGIAAGHTKVSDSHSQARAAHEADVLRRRLVVSQDSSSSLGQLVAAITPYADTFNITLEFESPATTTRADSLPDQIVDLVERIVQRMPPSTMSIRAIVDSGWEELVLVLPLVKYSDLVVDSVEDVVIEFQVESEHVYLSLRRPVQSP